MVELIEKARIYGRHLLQRQVDALETVLQSVQQEFGDAARDRRGLAGPGQFGQIQPFAAQTLLSAEVDVEGERAESADQVHVRHPKRSRMIVLLADTEQRAELRSDAGFFKNLPDGRLA